MERLLHSLRNVKFVVDESNFGKCFESFEHAFNEAKKGNLQLDCANFASLLVYELFDKLNYEDEKFEYKRGIELRNYDKLDQILYLCPLDVVGNDVDLSSHGQWIVKPFHSDDRWVGLTWRGVEAKTLAEWLECGSDMILEALLLQKDDDFVTNAALYSGEWAARRIVAEERCVVGWTCLRPPPRTRVSTRKNLKDKISAVKETLYKRKRAD